MESSFEDYHPRKVLYWTVMGFAEKSGLKFTYTTRNSLFMHTIMYIFSK